ncbi:MAG: hypothetical protein V1659_01030 [Candidatus Woesearchaeota archaeon]
MIRRLANMIAGRKRVLDEQMDHDGVMRLLRGLDSSTMIDVDYSGCSTRNSFLSFRNKTPADVADFVRRDFKPFPNCDYCEANHQVFSGDDVEKHYVDLRKGTIIASVGTDVVLGSPREMATLSYALKKTG